MRTPPDHTLVDRFRSWKQQLLDAGDTMPDDARWTLIGELYETLERLRVQAGQSRGTVGSGDTGVRSPLVLRGLEDIAAHLQISARTLKQWHERYAETDPLPLSQPGGRGGPTFAAVAELDAWILRRAGDPPGRDGKTPFEPPRRTKRVVLIDGKPR